MPKRWFLHSLHKRLLHRLSILILTAGFLQYMHYGQPLLVYAQSPSPQNQDHHTSSTGTEPTSIQEILAELKEIHGGIGPFVVAGYRIGKRALKELPAQPGAFTLLVQHYCPAEVQWSCIVDGLQASTHTSLGKLNLERITADKTQMRSVITNRKTGKQVIVRLSDTFLRRFLNTPMEQLEAKAKETVMLSDEEIFTLETTTIKQ